MILVVFLHIIIIIIQTSGVAFGCSRQPTACSGRYPA